MKTFKIKDTDIILTNYEKFGQGKIIVSDDWMGSYSYVWGSMGSKIEEFLLTINSGYFADKLCANNYVFSAKRSVKSVRRFIRTESELEYWDFMSAQKEMREELKELEYCENEYEFVDAMTSLPNKIACLDLSHKEEKEFKEIIEPIFTQEPWHFIEKETSRGYNWLYDLHRDIKSYLQNECTSTKN